MNQSGHYLVRRRVGILSGLLLAVVLPWSDVWAAGGVLKLITRESDHNVSIPARLELVGESGRRPNLRRAIRSGPGFVIDQEVELALSPGNYRFRIVRGPEYRVYSGNFEMQAGAADERVVELLRMVDMRSEGYLAGDLAWGGPANVSLPLKMASEDLHVAAILRTEPQPSAPGQPNPLVAGPSRPAVEGARRQASEPDWVALASPRWTGQSVHRDGDWLLYPELDLPKADSPGSDSAAKNSQAAPDLKLVTFGDHPAWRVEGKAAIVNPFAWQLPIWLATERADGIFVLGEWLREGTMIDRVRSGRPPAEIGFTGKLGPGRYAESIYQRILETGLRIAPLAGSGETATDSGIGYNRTYAIGPAVTPGDDRRVVPLETETDYYSAVWAGRTVLTNGPLLRPTLGGQAPGHVFRAGAGEVVRMSVELQLAVRDPVEYLEVIQNGVTVHSVRLDEFATAGGMIPELIFSESGWVMVHVVTEYPDHFRAAISAPWYVEFDETPRISRRAVEFFQAWLGDCEAELKKLPAEQLAGYIQPVRTARAFWQHRLAMANAD